MTGLGNAQILSIKFDVHNANPDRALPVFTELQITLFGFHFIRYKAGQRHMFYDRRLNEQEEDAMIEQVVEDLDTCFSPCLQDETEDSTTTTDTLSACIAQTTICESEDYKRFPLRGLDNSKIIDRDMEQDPQMFTPAPAKGIIDRDYGHEF